MVLTKLVTAKQYEHKKALSSFSETLKAEINKIWKSHYAMFMHNLMCHSMFKEEGDKIHTEALRGAMKEGGNLLT